MKFSGCTTDRANVTRTTPGLGRLVRMNSLVVGGLMTGSWKGWAFMGYPNLESPFQLALNPLTLAVL